MNKIEWKNVLIPTDFSQGSKEALPYAIGIAREMGAALALVHVVPTPPPFDALRIGIVLEEKLLAAEARKDLDKFRESEIPSDIAGRNLVLQGNAWQEITRLASEEKFDLIVIATHGRTGLKHFWFGSIAENVVRHAPCPVLTVREQPIRVYLPGENPMRVKKILAPIDFSNLSLVTLERAVALAERFDARIDVIYVSEPPAYTEFEYANLAMIESGLRDALEGRLAEVKERVPGLKDVLGNLLLRVGNPALEIVQAALVLNSDLITIATHGHTGLKRVAIGSTAEKVVRHAACPVLLFRK